ncbi:MAG: hypothetical protein ACTJIB_08580 [Pseudoalteromonas prydzensis]|uniref:ABC transporter permease n=1 Tax=Pseudoalteromonas prydzensis TaxID=182141 RepID=A0ABR9FRL5_9GAMM|nr:hypothetical protein [Pseudoalteromonas prydzensis]MBE0459454.1 hypothetical protein [Pseudoalteromonas prydzensis]
MMQVSKRPWYQGAVSFWLKDVGSASYFIAATITSFLCLIATGIEELITLMIMFATICMYSAIAWQSIKMQATEWQSLVVGYREHVMFQGKVFIVFSNLISILSIIIAGNINLLATLTLANLIGLVIWFLNRSFSHLFTSVCYFSYFVATLVCVLIEQLPVWLIPVNIIAYIAIALLHNNFSSAYVWRPDSLSNYRNGLQSGWSPIPSGFLSDYGSSINKGLFPLSYFVGSGLSQYLILLTLLCTIGVVINLFYNITEHVIFVLTLCLFAIVTLSLWGKIQKQNSWELLFTLPIYNSSFSAKVALSNSVLKLAILVASLCFITASALSLANPTFLIFNILSYSLACSAGVLLSFAIGNVCKNINLLSFFMCISFGLNMGLANYMFDHGNDISELIIMATYTLAMAAINRFTVRYL